MAPAVGGGHSPIPFVAVSVANNLSARNGHQSLPVLLALAAVWFSLAIVVPRLDELSAGSALWLLPTDSLAVKHTRHLWLLPTDSLAVKHTRHLCSTPVIGGLALIAVMN